MKVKTYKTFAVLRLRLPAGHLDYHRRSVIKTTLIVAQSIDGCITKHSGSGTAFCSDADADYFIRALKAFDSMVLGRHTYELNRGAIQASKAVKRLRIVQTRAPAQWASESVLDSIEFSSASPQTILANLEKRGCQRCALVGGTQSYASFLEADLVDALWLTIEPVVLGDGLRLANRELDTRFQLDSLDTLGKHSILAKYSKTNDPA